MLFLTFSFSFSILVDMDAGYTAHVVFTSAGSTKVIDIYAGSFFSGELVA